MRDEVHLALDCCGTGWRIHAIGAPARVAAERARDAALSLEARLDPRAPSSAIGLMNREGRVLDAHVARLVQRAAEYRELTMGAFDVACGALLRAVKVVARYHVRGDEVVTTAPLDLHGIAKGYLADRVARTLREEGVVGTVDAGGDVATPIGPVAIPSPHSPERVAAVLDTRWNIATSSRAQRRLRNERIYDPREGRVGGRFDQVTVVAKRDCTEADALATALSVLPYAKGRALVEGWENAEAMWIRGRTTVLSSGFAEHVASG